MAQHTKFLTGSRWFGFLNIWAALLFIPACLITYFRTGPFAWNGLLAFWLATIAFCIYYGALVILLFKAIGRTDYVGRLEMEA